MKKFTKSLLREWKSGIGRFISILAIIALGVGFLVGIMQTTPDMKETMDAYYCENNMYDIQIKSSLGLSEDDIDAIAALEKDGEKVAETVVPFVSTDAVVTKGSFTYTARINGVDFSEADTAVDRLTVIEGRLPQTETECVVERANSYFKDVSVGDTVSIAEYGDYGDVYEVESFTVTGIVSSPAYYYKDGRETSGTGTGVLGGVIYVCEEVYRLDDSMLGLLGASYTDCYLVFAARDQYDFFSDGYEEYAEECADLYTELAEERLAETNEMLAAFGVSAQWYVLNLPSSNVSYVSFALNVEKVAQIAGVFPVFFILVAALVAFTSMTRMVEEGRPQIGALKSLGYSNVKIASRYLLYCLVACFSGCGLGILFGFQLIPNILWEAYKLSYFLPNLAISFSPVFAVILLVSCAAIGVAVTLASCVSTLKEKPAALLQPKAPKAGKRILLERVKPLWNCFSFKYKATIRNIFRYKKNMFMTILSVAGCTALILAGFGLNDSVAALTEKQYTDVVLYDIVVTYSAAPAEEGELTRFLEEEADSFLMLYQEDGTILITDGGEEKRESVTVFVYGGEEFNGFIDLHTEDGEAIDLASADVILSQNIASYYNIGEGDTLTYRVASGKSVSLTVDAVAENYVGNDLYLSERLFAELFGEQEDNACLVCYDVEEGDIDSLSERLLSGGADSVSFTLYERRTYAGLSDTMALIIVVLVVCAGALAAIVLYNLTNINIEERRREIATLKVLGYKKGEVAGYIYRESAALTITGALAGLGVGYWLHRFLVSRINSVDVMFGWHIAWQSYLIAFALTLAFAAIVYFAMSFKLASIQMADSLKSNE